MARGLPVRQRVDVAVYIQCERCGRKYVTVQAFMLPASQLRAAREALAHQLGARPERRLNGRPCPKCGYTQRWMLRSLIRRRQVRWASVAAVSCLVGGSVPLLGRGLVATPVRAAPIVAGLLAFAALAGLLAALAVRVAYRRELAASEHHTALAPRWDIAPERDWPARPQQPPPAP